MVRGSGFWVQGLKELGFRVQGLRNQGLGFGRSWEGLLGRPWPKRPWQGLKGSIGRSWPGGKVEGYSHFCPPDHRLVRSSCILTYSVRGWLVNFSAGS